MCILQITPGYVWYHFCRITPILNVHILRIQYLSSTACCLEKKKNRKNNTEPIKGLWPGFVTLKDSGVLIVRFQKGGEV